MQGRFGGPAFSQGLRGWSEDRPLFSLSLRFGLPSATHPGRRSHAILSPSEDIRNAAAAGTVTSLACDAEISGSRADRWRLQQASTSTGSVISLRLGKRASPARFAITDMRRTLGLACMPEPSMTAASPVALTS
jgi:hypothetical protein